MVKRKIVLFSESLRITPTPRTSNHKFSIDGEAVAALLKKNIKALEGGQVEIEAVGFAGKNEFMEKVANAVKNKFAEFQHRRDVQVFIITLRDSDTSEGKKIAGLRRQIAEKIRKKIGKEKLKHFKKLYTRTQQLTEASV